MVKRHAIVWALLLLLTACSYDGMGKKQALAVMDSVLTEDRQHVRHTSAMEMEQAVRYLDNHGDLYEQAEAHYLLGRVYMDMGLAAEAMKQMQMAAETGGAGDEFCILAIDNIGHLHLNNGNRAEALTSFRRAYDLAAGLQDSILMVYAMRDMARALRSLGETELAMNCLKRAEQLLTLHTPPSTNHLPQTTLLSLYPEYISLAMQTGDRTTVERLFPTLRQHADQQPANGALLLAVGKIYVQLGRQDSAEWYLRRAMETENVQAHASAAQYMAELQYKEGQAPQAYKTALESLALTDSLRHRMATENRSLVASLQNQLDVERENARLHIRLILMVVASVVFLLLLYLFFRRRNNRLRQQAERYRQAQETLRRNSEAFMTATKQRIDELNRQIEDARQRNDELQERLLQMEKEQQEQELEQVRRQQSRQEQLTTAFRSSPLYQALEPLANGTTFGMVTPEQWQEIAQLLDDHADHFTRRLYEYCPTLKASDLQLCYLLRLGFNNVQISNLCSRTQQASTNARKRLFKKIFNREGAADDLNRFILSV